MICFVIFLCPLNYITYLCALHSTINIYICSTDYSVSGPLGVQGKAAFKKVQKVSENTTHAHCIWCTCTQIFCYLKICADKCVVFENNAWDALCSILLSICKSLTASYTSSSGGRLMLMDSESQVPPAKRMRTDDYLGSTSLILSPTSIGDFAFPAVDSVWTGYNIHMYIHNCTCTYLYIVAIGVGVHVY